MSYDVHEWGPVPVGGPVEEGGQCTKCGAFATSDKDTLCPLLSPVQDEKVQP